MTHYPSDGDIYAGWHSFGRWCALIGLAALLLAAAGFLLLHGYLTSPLRPSDQVFAVAAEWVGGGLFAVMALVVLGSLHISQHERGDVVVTPEGVRRVFRPGREEFFPRDMIAGFVARPAGGVVLIDRKNHRHMIVPRSIEGYRDCIAELKALGIPALPASRLVTKTAWGETLLGAAAALSWVLFFSERLALPRHRLAGILLLALTLAFAVFEQRKHPRLRWLNWLVVLGALLAVILRWGILH